MLIMIFSGPVLTGGEKVNGKWMWNGEPQLGKRDVEATFSTRSKPVKVFKWFPGKVLLLHHIEGKVNK